VAFVKLVHQRQVVVRIIPPEIRSLFSEADIAEIEANPVILGEDTERDAIDLVLGWKRHVQKIDSDRSLPGSDRSVWTEYDLAAALFLRDFLQLALDRLNPSVKARLETHVAAIDDQFRSYTVDDPQGRMAAVAHVDLTGKPWWWHRVPESGPIVEDLARYTEGNRAEHSP
jgi:hypothetical protein